jgi:heat shock protein HslJ
MEPTTSKTGINILIVISIVLVGASLATTFTKKQNVEDAAKVIAEMPAQTPVAEEPVVVEVTTTTTSTTTEVVTTASSTTATSTVNAKGFTEKKWTWVKTINEGKTTTPKKPTVFTITFAKDGTLTGTTDCNNFFGSYKVTDTKLTFGVLGSTQMFCEDSQESDFIISLQGTNSYSIDKSSNLTITNASSTMTLK